MGNRSITAAHIGLALGLFAAACSQPRTDPDPSDIAATPAAATEGSAWIEGEVESRQGARVFALDKNSQAFFTAESAPDGRYRIGPLPAGEYEVSVMWTLAGPAHVDNFAVASVTTTANATSRADFTQPGNGSLVVRFEPRRIPGTIVTEVQLFAGSQDNVTMARYRELQRMQAHRPRGRNTISADDTTTTFGGLPSGAYTVCAVTNVGGDDLHTICQNAELEGAAPVEVTLDVRVG